ncbi:lytic transglycosylase domain-containing protein [Psychroserpens ponticola]|uniref:Lytic transglycosylase domain-containing protein n=1 Tax=Psychroserpens ponticola TaxID=2932268 RepID=A0ABY7S0K1_9FLAO|nr:lytic transglycosylase domain-containing protein [Psychroserpens ponticola]WCO02827.1 lytic transglycosylase domain-containing protein [Psychroserpens ponticola]
MMNKVSNYFAIPLAICSVMFMALKPSPSLDVAMYSTEGLELDFTVQHDVASTTEATETHLSNPFQKKHTYFPYIGKSYTGFKEALAFKESRGNYFTVNTLGYLGKYQFGAETLKMIGIYNPNQFLYNPELQEKAFLANAERNKWILRKDIKRFDGKKINGVLVTESGILAAAHLAGPGSVKKYLRSYGHQNFSDAYGSTVKHYMKKFSGYDTSSIVPDRKAKAVL